MINSLIDVELQKIPPPGLTHIADVTGLTENEVLYIVGRITAWDFLLVEKVSGTSRAQINTLDGVALEILITDTREKVLRSTQEYMNKKLATVRAMGLNVPDYKVDVPLLNSKRTRLIGLGKDYEFVGGYADGEFSNIALDTLTGTPDQVLAILNSISAHEDGHLYQSAVPVSAKDARGNTQLFLVRAHGTALRVYSLTGELVDIENVGEKRLSAELNLNTRVLSHSSFL